MYPLTCRFAPSFATRSALAAFVSDETVLAAPKMLDRLVVSSLGIVVFFPDTLAECADCGTAVHLALLSHSNLEATEFEG